jgi:hypothetical protein
VSGTVLSNSGRYTGSATVSAVPEPATYGMLGGLGLVGAWLHAASKKPGCCIVDVTAFLRASRWLAPAWTASISYAHVPHGHNIGKLMESRLSRLEAVQTVLLEIGQKSSSCTDISEFLQAVHAALGRIMYAANFFVALSDQHGPANRCALSTSSTRWMIRPRDELFELVAGESPTAAVILSRERMS